MSETIPALERLALERRYKRYDRYLVNAGLAGLALTIFGLIISPTYIETLFRVQGWELIQMNSVFSVVYLILSVVGAASITLLFVSIRESRRIGARLSLKVRP